MSRYINLIYLGVYELLVLGQLARCPMHGYRIAGIIGDILGPFRRVQWGALYPLLNRLEQQGLIRAAVPASGEPPKRKVYALTDAGRERLHHHLMDTGHHLAEYATVFSCKVSLFFLLAPEERLYLSRHYTVYCQQNIDHLLDERRDLLQNQQAHLTERQIDDIITVMDHRVDVWRRERAWAEELITQQQTTKEAV